MLATMTDLLRGFEPAPQDLVLTLLGAHHVPRDARRGVVGRAGAAARGVRLHRGRRQGRAEPARRPRPAGPQQGRPARALRAHPAHARRARRGRPADLHPRRAAARARRRGPCCGTRSPRTAGSPAPGSSAGCGSSASARCRTAPGSRRTTASRSSPRCSPSWTWPSTPGVMLGRPATAVDFGAFVAPGVGPRRARRAVPGVRRALPRPRGRATTAQALLLRTRLVHTFREFPFLDPELPEDLVPAPTYRAEALRLFHDLYPALAPAAQRYFDEVTVP